MRLCQVELSSLGDITKSFSGLLGFGFFLQVIGTEETLNRSKMVCCNSKGLDLELGCCINLKTEVKSLPNIQLFNSVIPRNSFGEPAVLSANVFLTFGCTSSTKRMSTFKHADLYKTKPQRYPRLLPFLPDCFILNVFCFTSALLIRYYFWFNNITAI